MDSIMELDILEQDIVNFDSALMRILLKDRTTKKNIIWATADYAELGEDYTPENQITIEAITGPHAKLIQPRTAKAQEEQTSRTRDKAEVFTPSWVCNEQNSLLDEQWFGRENVFNIIEHRGWTTITEKIVFPLHCRKGWKEYVYAKQLEISCGEAPYLVSRYDTVSGVAIPVKDRIGLLDRKLRVINENTETEKEWMFWAQRAVQSCYGYEYQGDNLLLARENILATIVEYYWDRFQKRPEQKWQEKIAKIISWNIWQMDGLKAVVPMSCVPTEDDEADESGLSNQLSLFEPEENKTPQLTICPGCKKNNIRKHTGKYCLIRDWTTNGVKEKGTQRFVDILVKEEEK